MTAPTLTPAQQRLVDAMRAAVDSGQWKTAPTALLSGVSIRYTRTIAVEPTKWWTKPTAEQSVALTVAVSKPTRIWLDVQRGPWAGTRDLPIPLKRAMAVIADPDAVLDDIPKMT